jgi:hypothetical protein
MAIAEVDQPPPEPGEVLVCVHATSINDFDLGILSGKPLFIRYFFAGENQSDGNMALISLGKLSPVAQPQKGSQSQTVNAEISRGIAWVPSVNLSA